MPASPRTHTHTHTHPFCLPFNGGPPSLTPYSPTCRFDPTRWLHQDESRLKLGSFGHHAHACLGRAFATAVSHVFVYELLHGSRSVGQARPGATKLVKFPAIVLGGEPVVLTA
jgi:cytochrome P450